MPGHNLMPKLKPTAFFLPSPIEQRGAGTSNTQPSKLKTDAPVHMHGCCLLVPSQAPTHPGHINPTQAAVTLPQWCHNQIAFPQPMTDISLVPTSRQTLSPERGAVVPAVRTCCWCGHCTQNWSRLGILHMAQQYYHMRILQVKK